MKVQEVSNATGRASICVALASEASRVTQLAVLLIRVVVATGGTFFNAFAELQKW